MLKHLIGLVLLGFFAGASAQAQLLNLPNGVSDIGTNASGTGVGIGTDVPQSPLHLYNQNAMLTLHGQENHLPTSYEGIRLKDDRSANDFLFQRSFFPNWGTGGVHLSFSGKKGIHFMDNADEIRFSTHDWATTYSPLRGPVAPFRFDDRVAMPTLIVGTSYSTPGGGTNFSMPTGFGFAVQPDGYFKGNVLISNSSNPGFPAGYRLSVDEGAYIGKNVLIEDPANDGVARLRLKGPDGRPVSSYLSLEDDQGETSRWFRIVNNTEVNRLEIASPERGNIMILNRFNGNIGISTDPGGEKMKIVSHASGGVLAAHSGSPENSATVNIGRSGAELTLAAVAVNGHYSADAAVGDMVIRTEDNTKKLIFNNGSGSSSLVVQKDKIGIGITANIADRLHVNNGITRITGTDAAADISTPGLRLGSHSSNYSWIQSSQAPLALNPNSGTYVAIGFDPLDPTIVLPDPQDNYKLMVKGKMLVEEVKVRLAANWPDYVFAPDYKLAPLEEVESFIQENRHLPQVPAAATVEKEGFELAAMNALLLKKVEELTLYLIEQNKKMEALEKRLERIEE